MDHVFSVHVLQAKTNLTDVKRHLLLWDLSLLLHLMQGPVRDQLSNQVDALLITEEPVEGRQMTMLKVGLDLYLPHNLLLKILSQDLRLQ